MTKKFEVPKVTEEQKQVSREIIMKKHGKPLPGVVFCKCFDCITKYGEGNPCRCGKGFSTHVPFSDENKRFSENIFETSAEQFFEKIDKK